MAPVFVVNYKCVGVHVVYHFVPVAMNVLEGPFGSSMSLLKKNYLFFEHQNVLFKEFPYILQDMELVRPLWTMSTDNQLFFS